MPSKCVFSHDYCMDYVSFNGCQWLRWLSTNTTITTIINVFNDLHLHTRIPDQPVRLYIWNNLDTNTTNIRDLPA